MKKLLQFVRTTLVGGLLFLVPIVVLVMILGKALAVAHKLADPLAARFPVESVVGVRTPLLLAIVLLVFFCFLAGFLARAALARKMVRGLEAAVLSKVPGYALLKSVSESLLGVEPQGAFPVVLARLDDTWQIGLRVEELDNGLVAVFVPDAPNPQSGAVVFLTPDQFKPTDIPLAAALKCLKHHGAGSNALLRGLPVGATLAILVLSVISAASAQTVPDSALSRSVAATNAPATNAPSKLRSPEDGWLDLSGFMDGPGGFVPLVMPITEPAVGYGAAGGLAFVDKPKGETQAGFGRPNITAVGAMGTQNGSWGVLAGDSRYWLDDRLQTLVGLAYASVNLDYYGLGQDNLLKNRQLRYNLEPLGGLVQAKYRLGHSRWWGGLGYAMAATQVQFDAPPGTPGLPSFQSDSRVGGMLPSVSYDSRDNMFTPLRGTYVEATAGVFSQALGGDDEFQRVNLVAMRYLPLHPKWTLGVRADANLTFGDVPFYMRPSVSLRGVPAMRYQGEQVAQIEAELRWQFWKRFSLVGFAGGGAAWTGSERFEKTQTVVTGGTGFRYELARKYGLHMGVDVAFGPDDPAIYVQFGSAWMRP